MTQIPEMNIDFLPEGQLKWRCIEKAEGILRRKHGRGPFMASAVGGADEQEVMNLAREIYAWVTMSEGTVDGHRIRDVGFDGDTHINVHYQDSEPKSEESTDDMLKWSDGPRFDSKVTADKVFNALQVRYGARAARRAVNVIASTGVKFVSTDSPVIEDSDASEDDTIIYTPRARVKVRVKYRTGAQTILAEKLEEDCLLGSDMRNGITGWEIE